MNAVRDVCRSLAGGTPPVTSLNSARPRIFYFQDRQLSEIRDLSEGGYAFVSIVKDTKTGDLFALKKVACDTPELLRAAQCEASFLEMLPPHPNIIQCYGSVSVQQCLGKTTTVYTLLEFCPGGHLLDVIHRTCCEFTLTTVIDIATQVVSAVAHLHAQPVPITHRDIKLENILLDANGVPKLCDFGSASTTTYNTGTMNRAELLELEDVISRTTSLIYRPPEMVDLYRKDIIDSKVDIWMLGCVLYALIFRQHPFHEASSSVLAITNASFDIPGLLAVVDFNSGKGQLIDLIIWLLSPSPEQRPTAQQVIAVLQSCQNGEGHVQMPAYVVARRDGYIKQLKDAELLKRKCWLPLTGAEKQIGRQEVCRVSEMSSCPKSSRSASEKKAAAMLKSLPSPFLGNGSTSSPLLAPLSSAVCVDSYRATRSESLRRHMDSSSHQGSKGHSTGRSLKAHSKRSMDQQVWSNNTGKTFSPKQDVSSSCIETSTEASNVNPVSDTKASTFSLSPWPGVSGWSEDSSLHDSFFDFSMVTGPTSLEKDVDAISHPMRHVESELVPQ